MSVEICKFSNNQWNQSVNFWTSYIKSTIDHSVSKWYYAHIAKTIETKDQNCPTPYAVSVAKGVVDEDVDVYASVNQLKHASRLLENKVANGDLSIFGALYDMETGCINILG